MGTVFVIAIDPDPFWTCNDSAAWRMTPDGKPIGTASDEPFASLRELITASEIDIPDDCRRWPQDCLASAMR